MTGALAQRASAHRDQTRLCVLVSLIAMVATLCVATTASAERPTKLLKLRDTNRNAAHVLQFEVAESYRPSYGGELVGPSHHTALVSEVLNRPVPRWPSASDRHRDITPPVVMMRNQRRDDPRNQLAWGLAGTGASIFTGALLYHIETMALQDEYEQLSSGAHNARYREIRNQIDQTRKVVLTLYAVGGSMITSGVVLMANDERGGPTAKIGPAWMNGGPAARLKISF